MSRRDLDVEAERERAKEREAEQRGAAAERARLLPVMEQVSNALFALCTTPEEACWCHEPPEHSAKCRLALAAYQALAAALAPSAAREEQA